MSAASQAAYAEAERIIAQAVIGQAIHINFYTPATRALTDLPQEISKLKNLVWLDLRDTQVADLRPIAMMTTLSGLQLGNSQVADLRPVAGLTRLTNLELYNTRIVDITPILGMTDLTELDIGNTQVVDISPVQGLSKLTHLWLKNTLVADIAPVAGLTNLTTLNLNNSRVYDPRPLMTLTKLSTMPRGGGLTFIDTPFATRPEFERIARIENDSVRAQSLFDALKDWAPPDPPALAGQVDTGLRYAVSLGGATGYAPLQWTSDPTLQQRQLHALLVEDAAGLALSIGGGHNMPFAIVARKVERYCTALGSTLADMSPVLLWKMGNDIRLILRTDSERLPGDMSPMPRLDAALCAGLEGFIATHNAFAALHPDLSALDHAMIDPAERHKAEVNRALLQAAIDAFAVQTRLILQEVVHGLRDLHVEASGTSDTALRATRIELDSIQNLLKALTAQGIIEARSEGFATKIAGDVRAATVGVAATALGPEIAATYPELLTLLQPTIEALLSALHGHGTPLSQGVEWVVGKMRQALKK